MMDILIKSFFRPYLLDRCLYSIKKYVTGNYRIIILDDGTPEKYLQKIRSKYPDVIIKKSPFYEDKISKINDYLNNGTRYLDKRIPASFWYENIQEASTEYLILTEDDVWFTNPIDLDFYEKEMRNHDIDLLKIGYGGDGYKSYVNHQLTDEISYHNPKLILNSSKFYGVLLNNTFGITTFLEKYKFISKKWRRQLWLMYNIPMPIYKKTYLSFLWKNQFNRVIESLQLHNALKWHLKNKKSKHKFSFLNKEVMRTTIISTVSFNYYRGMDMISFNHKLNELWYDDQLDSYENLPYEMTENYLEKILTLAGISFSEWKEWNNQFKKTFQNY